MKCDKPGCTKKATTTRSWSDNPKTLLTHANLCDDCNHMTDVELSGVFAHGTLAGLYGEMQLVLNSRPDATPETWEAFSRLGDALVPLWSDADNT